MNKTIWLLAMVVFGINANAQQVHTQCGTDEYAERFMQLNPELGKAIETKKSELFNLAESNSSQPTKKSQLPVYTIPVVFHVIYNSPEDNINRTQIEDALRILNEDFRKTNPDAGNLRPIFQNVQADSEVEFALAKVDPNGVCTEGITRMQSSLSVMASPRDRVKTLVRWNPDKYLNIWVVNSIRSSSSGSGIVLGYANFPWMPASTDGIVIRHDALGRIGTSEYDGRTLTHEVGHYLGLLHTFQSGCNGGDNIADTPPVASASYGCSLFKNSCSNDSPNLPDMIENFMDYSDGECQNTYTLGQKNVMRSTLQSNQFRSNLVSAGNLTATGVTNPPACQPLALFRMEKRVLCPGDTARFIDETEDGDPDTYSWFLPGGTPNPSSDKNPEVIYTTAGVYPVTLTVGNAAGKDSVTKTEYIHVKPLYNNDVVSQWVESFEDPTLNAPNLSVISQDNITFELTGQAASNGGQSLYINNFNSQFGGIDELISPAINTQFAKGLQMTFDFAYAPRTNDDADRLTVSISTDCGRTWFPRRIMTGALLATAPITSGSFAPTASQWNDVTIPLSQFARDYPVLIKFTYEGGGGNNFYLDNINLTSNNISLDEAPLSEKLAIYPNPSSGVVHIDFSSSLNQDADLHIYDLYGKEVRHLTLDGKKIHNTIDNLNLAHGVYILNLVSGKESHSQKLIVE